MSGNILVNGKERNSKVFEKISAYIMQDDKLQETFLKIVEKSDKVKSFFLQIGNSWFSKKF